MSARIARRWPLLATGAVLIALYFGAAIAFPGFRTWFQFTRLFADNATLGLAAVGMTFVILSGGIDLSVGAVIACASMLLALLAGELAWPLWLAAPAVLASGAAFGGGMGGLIHAFRLPPFLVTLAGMFLARGAALLLSPQKRIELGSHDAVRSLSLLHVAEFTLPALVLLAAVGFAALALRWTRWGRTVYAIGSDESAARLMGLAVAPARVGVYAVSGLCAAAGGIVHVIGTQAGDASSAFLLELDAIAAVVIGGTLLAGGRGSVLGTLLGVLILAIITTIPGYFSDLNSWWTRLIIGALLLLFVSLQRVSQRWREE